ncbi:hypothetical protein TSUD_137280 [Trifolium subterraneum]|uniref:Aminotransferase-like plant mobile domain-containing protein n=1 Tax=Trifolium subterraneum TaxID=3900 RepID=A0A2Z6NMS8_TRISU|nr:hypothetical protein TSUD_137280 [Trifolium subterraneum]
MGENPVLSAVPIFLSNPSVLQSSSMASSSKSTIVVHVSSTDMQPIQENGMEFVSEPTPEIETCKIWEKQVLIPHLLCSEQLAFAGPFPPLSKFNDEVKEIFPGYATCEPSAFVNSTYNMSYMEPRHRVFRSAPSTRKSYIEWLDKVQAKFGESWRQYDIFDLIQLSRECPKYHPEMLLAALHFWDSSTSTFQFKAGMLTPTLLDVAAITEVTDHEHIAFLTYWLSQFIFCTGSLQVVTRLIPLAIQIHEGRNFSFGKLLLASLYHSLIDGSDNLKSSDKPSNKDKLTMAGPIWLLQLWLNATFASNLNLTISPFEESKVAKRNIEASRLALFQQKTPDFPATDPNKEASVNELWLAFLSPAILSSRLGVQRAYLGLVGYQPNLVARQFGLTQFMPKSLFKNKDDIVLGNSGMSEAYYQRRLKAAEEMIYQINPFPFKSSCFCTLEFANWWNMYYKKNMPYEETIMQRVNAGLDALQLTSKRKASSSTPSVSTASEVIVKKGKKLAATEMQAPPEIKSRKRQNSSPPTTKTSKKTKQDISKPASVEEQQDEDIDSPMVEPITQGDTDKGKHPATVEPQTKSTTGPPEKKKKKERKRAKIRQLVLEDEEDDQEETSTQQVQPTQTIPTSTTEVSVVTTSPDVVNIPLSKGESTNSCLADSNPKDTTLLPDSTEERSPPKTSNVEKGPSKETPVGELQNLDAVPVEIGAQDNPTAEESGESSSSEQTASQEESDSTSGEEENSTEDTADNTAFDDETIKEAEEGGDDILPVSSTSKLSADIGLSEDEFVKMQEDNPATTLNLLLTKKWAKSQTSSEGTQSNSSLQSTDSRQAALMAKLQTDFVEQDVLQAIEANPATAFSYLAFLKKLQNPLTDRSIQKIAVEAKKGIDYFSASVAIDGEVQTLVETNDILDVELATYRRLYEELKASL